VQLAGFRSDIFLGISILVFAVLACLKALGQGKRTDKETPFEAMPEGIRI